jgi:hypothetical protein
MCASAGVHLHAVSSLCKLIGGNYPVKHFSDYIGSSDRKAFPVAKPSLPLDTTRRVQLKINVTIGRKEMLMALQEVVKSSLHFEVVFSGMGFTSSFVPRSCFSELCLDEITVNSGFIKSSEGKKLMHLTPNGTLAINVDSAISEDSYRWFLSQILGHRRTATPIGVVVSDLDANLSAALFSLKIQTSSFIFLSSQASKHADLRDLLERFFDSNSEVFEYIQLQNAPVVPLDSLQRCSNLRVLNLATSSPKVRVSATQLFLALQHLHCLEYFEWSQSLNILTKDILAQYNLLSKYLPNLVHWHWRLGYLLLFISDLDKPEFEPLEPILSILLEGKMATISCETYKFALDNRHFKHWLRLVRPQVCFVVGGSPILYI